MSKEEVDYNELTRATDFPLVSGPLGGTSRGGIMLSRGSPVLGLSDEEERAVAMHPETFITYKVGFKCKHCGETWTKIMVEEKQLPREYVLDEED